MHALALLAVLEEGATAVLILLLQVEHIRLVESLKHTLPIEHALLGYQLRIQSQGVRLLDCTL